MKITKQRLQEIIKEEISYILNEISPRTEYSPAGFKGIEKMANQAEWALDNLKQKFEPANPPEEIFAIQKFLEAIKKTSWWSLGANEIPYAMHHMPPEEYKRQFRRFHTPAYKRDTKKE